MKLIAYSEGCGEAGYIAWIDHESFKGMVVQAKSINESFEELLISFKVKLAFDYGIDPGSIKVEAVRIDRLPEKDEDPKTKTKEEKEISLTLA